MKLRVLVTAIPIVLALTGCSTTTPEEAAARKEADAKRKAAEQQAYVEKVMARRKAEAEREANRRAADVQRENEKRSSEAQKLQGKYASYTTPQLQLKRQEIAASIPSWYWGTGIAGAIQAGQIEGRKNEVAEIDRELLRRAESGDTTGQQKVWFMVISDPPGAKIEADGRFMGVAPTIVRYHGNPGATCTIQATPATLERPTFGCALGFSDIANGTIDFAIADVVNLVFPNSPASRMGLMKGDKILAVNDVSLPQLSGTKESAVAWQTSLREQMERVGFGSEVTLKVLRDGAEKELKGQTTEQVAGRYFVQEKVIHPLTLDKQIVMFDLRTQVGPPIVLGTDTFHPSSSPVGKTFTGTGFAIADGGYVLTCHHVVEKSDDIQIRDATGANHKAKVIASDAGNDLCLLRATDLNVKPIPAAPPNSVSTGEIVYLLGFPMEGLLENQVPVAGSGVIASLKGLKGDPRHYQVTLPINPGNSGGPVLDPSGRWIAVASHKLNDLYSLGASESIPQGVNFAVKGTLFIPLLDSIPEVKLPTSESTNTFTLQELSKRFSDSVLLITSKH